MNSKQPQPRSRQPSQAPPPWGDGYKVSQLVERLDRDIRDGSVPPPSMPEAALEAERLLREHEPDLVAVGRAIEADPELTLALLRVANSPMFRRGRTIGDARQATQHLGPSVTHQLVYTAVAERAFAPRVRPVAPMLRSLWSQTLRTAQLTRSVARAAGTRDPDAAYLGALLQEIGLPSVVVHIAKLNRELSKDDPKQSLPPPTWMLISSAYHQPVSEETVASWKLPEVIVELVRHPDHYQAGDSEAPVNAMLFSRALLHREKSAEAEAAVVLGQAVLKLDEVASGALVGALDGAPR